VALTSRELVYRALEFKDPPRAPVDFWAGDLAGRNYPKELKAMRERFPPDFGVVDDHFKTLPRTKGDKREIGEFTDAWNCTRVNIQWGVVGEVKDPIIKDWSDTSSVHFPVEYLTSDRDKINRQAGAQSGFIYAPNWLVNPFERLQFLRGTENVYMDLADPPRQMLEFIKKMQDLFAKIIAVWADTDVDAIFFSDDWGSQNNLLIDPAMWRRYFKPMYKEYCEIAKARDKKVFMHSDGNILAIYPDLIEIGVDALNSQVFCMGFDKLQQFSGKITFWGEIDRQRLLAFAKPEEVREAVINLHANLWKKGGCIAQCEFGAGAKPENVRAVYETWEKVFQ